MLDTVWKRILHLAFCPQIQLITDKNTEKKKTTEFFLVIIP